VKFGEYVTGGGVKVPEKFGFNWSIFGWFGHFNEHVTRGVLGFGRNGYLRCENPPEGAKNLQECSRNIKGLNHALGFIGFDRNCNWHKRVERGASAQQNREGGRPREKGAAHREG
jgi:hypothetical protein